MQAPPLSAVPEGSVLLNNACETPFAEASSTDLFVEVSSTGSSPFAEASSTDPFVEVSSTGSFYQVLVPFFPFLFVVKVCWD